MHVIEQYVKAKSATIPSEDEIVVTSSYAAVIDGATPKSAYRMNGEETPGHFAARIIADGIRQLPPLLTAHEALDVISRRLSDVTPAAIPASALPTASVVIYSESRHEVWSVGDCQFTLFSPQGLPLLQHRGHKLIDDILSRWRQQIIVSYLNRHLMTAEEIRINDPGRRIIQPFITRQTAYQNMSHPHRLAFGVVDGRPIPQQFISVFPLPDDAATLVLASDGLPHLAPSLDASVLALQQAIATDPLCIGELCGTKGIAPGNATFDDVSYLRLEIHSHCQASSSNS